MSPEESQHIEEEMPEEVLPSLGKERSNKMPTLGQLSVALGFLALVFGASYIPGLSREERPSAPNNIEQRIVESVTADHIEKVFQEANVTAEAAYVWDVSKQRALYNKNAGAQLPLASLTKLMTALVSYELVEDTNSIINIPLEAIFEEGESGFEAGEEFQALSLIDFTLITSSNDGAYALAAAAGAASDDPTEATETFVDIMNRRAEEIGLSQTYFTNPNGLDVSDIRSGSYGSARDMAFLMEYLITSKPEVLEQTANSTALITDIDGKLFVATNTNEVADEIPGLIGSKTGYTVLAGGNLVVAFDTGLNHPVVISVLGSTREGRFEDVLELVRLTKRALIPQ